MPTVRKARVGRPSVEEAGEIEARILDRAWSLFVEGGYAALTHDALSRLERMSKQTIYARFPSKAALFDAAARRRLVTWRTENRILVDARFADPVAAFIDLSLRAALSRDAVAMSRLLGADEPHLRDLRELAWTQVRLAEERFAELLVGLPDGRAELDVRLAAQAILDMVMGHAFRTFADLPTGEALEAHIQTSTPRLLAMANALIGRSLEVGLDEDRPRDRTIKS